MTTGIYGIFDSRDMTCLYVGQSKDVEARSFQHLNRIRRRSKRFNRDFLAWLDAQEDGVAVLSFHLLEECEDEDTVKNALECLWFSKLRPRFFGKRPSLRAYVSHSEATRAAIGNGVASAAASSDLRQPKAQKPQAPVSRFMALSKDALVELYSTELLSLRTIGERYGVSQPRVLARLRELGIERRRRGTLTEGQRKPAPILCATCGTGFVPARSTRRFCSKLCARHGR